MDTKDTAAYFIAAGDHTPMMSDGKYVGADSNSSFAALIRSPTLPDAFNAWSFSDNNVTQLDGGVSFCSEGGVVVILLPGDRCATPVALIQTGKWSTSVTLVLCMSLTYLCRRTTDC